jgi:hypothetical protein
VRSGVRRLRRLLVLVDEVARVAVLDAEVQVRHTDGTPRSADLLALVHALADLHVRHAVLVEERVPVVADDRDRVTGEATAVLRVGLTFTTRPLSTAIIAVPMGTPRSTALSDCQLPSVCVPANGVPMSVP